MLKNTLSRISRYFKQITGKPYQSIYRQDGLYMERYCLIPKNRLFNIYIHHFHGSDDEIALHDHPWYSLGMILKGTYLEHTTDGVKQLYPFRPKFRTPNFYHRVELINGPVWTLFITGPRLKSWGFLCPKGHVDFKEVISKVDETHRSLGCPE